MRNGSPNGALTIDGPKPETGREAARLRFFILAESIRGLGLGKLMLAAAMQFCRERSYQRVFLTTLPGLNAAMCLYESQGFIKVGESEVGFHGSRFVELTMEYHLG